MGPRHRGGAGPDRRRRPQAEGDASAQAFAPDGDRLVVVGFESHGLELVTDDWRPVGAFSTLSQGYSHLLVEPRARMMFLASATDVAIWDLAELRRRAPRISLAGDGANDAIFLAQAADEPVLVVASQSEVAPVDLRESTWRASACRVADRKLTEAEWERLPPDRDDAPACG